MRKKGGLRDGAGGVRTISGVIPPRVCMDSKGVTVVLKLQTDTGERSFYAHPQSGREILALCTAPAPGPNRFTPFEGQRELPAFSQQWRASLWLHGMDARICCFHTSGAAIGGLLFPLRFIFEDLVIYLDDMATTVVGYACEFKGTRGHTLRHVTQLFNAFQCTEQRKRKHEDAFDALDEARKHPRRTADEQEAALLVLTAPLTEQERKAKELIDTFFY